MANQEFGIFDEINSEFIAILVASLGNYEILGLEILEDHGIDPKLLDNEWISIQQWIDAFKELAARLGPSEIGILGIKIAEHFFSAKEETMFNALTKLQVTHDEHHQGKVGSFDVVQLGSNIVQITCTSPYPCTFDRRMILTIAQKIVKSAKIKHLPASCRDLGDKQCVYLIRS